MANPALVRFYQRVNACNRIVGTVSHQFDGHVHRLGQDVAYFLVHPKQKAQDMPSMFEAYAAFAMPPPRGAHGHWGVRRHRGKELQLDASRGAEDPETPHVYDILETAQGPCVRYRGVLYSVQEWAAFAELGPDYHTPHEVFEEFAAQWADYERRWLSSGAP